MKIVRLADMEDDAWDSVAATSDDAWFWHTTHYLRYWRQTFPTHRITDESFALVDEGRTVAICPALIDHDSEPLSFGCGGDPIPAPAFLGLAGPAREAALDSCVSRLRELAAIHGVKYGRFRLPPFARTAALKATSLTARGFVECPTLTQLISLEHDEQELWSAVRKGHRADIKRAERVCEVSIRRGREASTDAFERYRVLHRLDAGRETRPRETFMMMRDWAANEHAALFEATVDGQPVAFALIITFASAAYYGSGCRDPQWMHIPAGHLLQWRVVQWLKDAGYSEYDIGIQHFGPEWFHIPSDKDIGISRFKRGFGGVATRLPLAEYFFDPSLVEDTFRQRAGALRAWLAS